MLQEVMTSPGVIEFRDVPIPEIRDDQVLVKMMRLGICGSDIHVYHGKHLLHLEYMHSSARCQSHFHRQPL